MGGDGEEVLGEALEGRRRGPRPNASRIGRRSGGCDSANAANFAGSRRRSGEAWANACIASAMFAGVSRPAELAGEEVRRGRHVPEAGDPSADVLDVGIRAEDLVDDEHHRVRVRTLLLRRATRESHRSSARLAGWPSFAPWLRSSERHPRRT